MEKITKVYLIDNLMVAVNKPFPEMGLHKLWCDQNMTKRKRSHPNLCLEAQIKCLLTLRRAN